MWRELNNIEQQYSVLLSEDYNNEFDKLIDDIYNPLSDQLIEYINNISSVKEIKDMTKHFNEYMNNYDEAYIRKYLSDKYLPPDKVKELALTKNNLPNAVHSAVNINKNMLVDVVKKRLKKKLIYKILNIVPKLASLAGFITSPTIIAVLDSLVPYLKKYHFITYLVHSLLAGNVIPYFQYQMIYRLTDPIVEMALRSLDKYLNVLYDTEDKNIAKNKLKAWFDKYANTHKHKIKVNLLSGIYAFAGDELRGYLVSEILDTKICDFCKYISDGMKLNKNYKWIVHWIPPYHVNCRGMLLPIFKKDLPVDWTTDPGFTPAGFFALPVDQKNKIIERYKRRK